MLAKVIARLLGLTTDEVFRRAERERRRQRRVQRAIAAAIVAIAVLGSVFAWQSHQRGQMLTEVETLVSRYTPAEDGGAAGGAERRSLTEAITAIAEGAASDPRYRQALALIKDGKPAEAEPLLKAVAEDKKKLAAKQNREAAAAFRNLAAIARVSDPARARDYYAEAASLDPDNVEGVFWHGWMQMEAGQLGTAEAAFRRITEKGAPSGDDWSPFLATTGAR